GMKDILSGELERLLAGEDLATETLENWQEDSAQTTPNLPDELEIEGLTPAWSLAGSYTGVAFDQQSGKLCALLSNHKLQFISQEGEILTDTELAKKGSLLRLGNLIGSAEPEFVTMVAWGKDVSGCSREGELLWTYSHDSGVDDIWCADLDRDGIHEVIVGYNGGGGLHVLDSQGKLLWKTTSIGNVWHVTAGEFLGDGQVQVVTTSARGNLHVFSRDGQSETTIETDVYANMVRMVKLPDEPSALALVGGSGQGETLLLVDKLGNERWKLVLPTLATEHIDSLDANSDLSWAAVGLRGGLVHVVDLVAGKILASVDQQGNTPQVTLLPRAGDSPLLVVATGNRLNAFVVEPESSDEVQAVAQEQY
ncbi:MAG: VCBS repeat-containing protein, partial [Planctomycetes bacterium]|nr:VCBS repeat-containing protein [Planctomycetota bacterium]